MDPLLLLMAMENEIEGDAVMRDSIFPKSSQ